MREQLIQEALAVGLTQEEAEQEVDDYLNSGLYEPVDEI